MVIQEAGGTPICLPSGADGAEPLSSVGESSPAQAAADAAVARLREMSVDLRGCALLDRDDSALAATGQLERWSQAGAGFLAAADAAADREADHVHVATEEGEVFAVRHGDLAMVAVAERFTLASLMILDMRAVLRDLVVGKTANSAEPADGGGGR